MEMKALVFAAVAMQTASACSNYNFDGDNTGLDSGILCDN